MNFPKKYSHQTYKPRKNITQKSEKTYAGVVPPGQFQGDFSLDSLRASLSEDVFLRYHANYGHAVFAFPVISCTEKSAYASLASLVKKGKKPVSYEEVVEEWKKEFGVKGEKIYENLSIFSSEEHARTVLDREFQQFVETFFIDFYKKGYIAYEESVVSYSEARGSVIAEDEVRHEEKEGRWYHIIYFVSGSDAELQIMTDKPEMIFADVAIAVHPKDKRYKKLIGKKVIIPALNKAIPIIGDIRVNMAIDEGIKRITPSLSKKDFDIARDHDLDTSFSIVDKKGFFTQNAGIFVGQKAETEARENTVELLRSKGNLTKIEVGNIHEAQCRETGCRIERIISHEWFVKGSILRERVIAGYNNGDFTLSQNGKSRFETSLLEGNDWCISRTGSIGFEIPAYFEKESGALLDVTNDPLSLEKKYEKGSVMPESRVLDKHFLDALIVLFLLEKEKKSENIFSSFSHATLPIRMTELWALPVLMLGYEKNNATPIQSLTCIESDISRINVETHAETYGYDAIRLAILLKNTEESGIREYFSLLTKLWNILRFIVLEIGEIGNFADILAEVKKDEKSLRPEEIWILNEFTEATKNIEERMEEGNIAETFQVFEEMLMEKFAPITLEAYKNMHGNQGKNILAIGAHWFLFFTEIFAPMIAEELSDLVFLDKRQSFSGEIFWNTGEKNDLHQIIEILSTVRKMRGKYHVKPQDACDVIIVSSVTDELLLEENTDFIRGLGNIAELTITTKKPHTQFQGYELSGSTEIYMNIPSYEESIQEELGHLEEIIEEKKKYIRTLSDKLGDNAFLQSAPEHIIRTEMQKRHVAVEQVKKFEERKKELEGRR